MPGPQFENPAVLEPLRHEDSNVDVSRRFVRYGARLGGTGTTDHGFGKGFDQYGRMVPDTTAVGADKNTVGDIISYGLWPNDTRSIPAWSLCFPAVITSTSPVKAKPIWKNDYSADARFLDLTVTLPPGAPAPAVNDPGLVIFGTNEYNQENLFLPTKGNGSGGGGGWYGDGSDVSISIATPSGAPFTTGHPQGGVKYTQEFILSAGPFMHGGGLGNYVFDLDTAPMAFLTDIPNNTYLHFLTRPLFALDLTISQVGANNWLAPCGSWICCTGSINAILSMDGDVGWIVKNFVNPACVAAGINQVPFNTTATQFGQWLGTFVVSGNTFLCPNDEGLAGNTVVQNTALFSGDGGANGGGTIGGSGGGGGSVSGTGGFRGRTLPSICTFHNSSVLGAAGRFQGGTGGGDGDTGGGAAFGHGGFGGGPVCVRSRHVTSLTIKCRGGHGEPASGAGNAGGGGGGNPGWAAVVSDDTPGAGVTFVGTGGTGGAGVGTGGTGGTGGATGTLLAIQPVV